MLATHAKFRELTPKAVCDTSQAVEVLIKLSCESREEVDAHVAKALMPARNFRSAISRPIIGTGGDQPEGFSKVSSLRKLISGFFLINGWCLFHTSLPLDTRETHDLDSPHGTFDFQPQRHPRRVR